MLLRREAVRALAGVEGRLLHPVPDRLGRGLKLAPELLGRSAMPDQLDHLPPERRRVRPMALRHRGRSLPPQPWGVHETGSTPDGTTLLSPPGATLRPGALQEGTLVVAMYREQENGDKVLTRLFLGKSEPAPATPSESPKRSE